VPERESRRRLVAAEGSVELAVVIPDTGARPLILVRRVGGPPLFAFDDPHLAHSFAAGLTQLAELLSDVQWEWERERRG
jgi:hypothetical protein